MNTGTVQFHRVLLCPPERVFRAFTTPAALVKTCHLGWQESLGLLRLLVEPDIPG